MVETFGLYERDQSFIRIEDDSLTQHVLRLPNPAPLEKVEGNEVVIQDCYVMDFSFETSEGEVKYTGYESVLRNVKMKVIDGEWRVFASRDADEGSDGQAECAGLIDELAS